MAEVFVAKKSDLPEGKRIIVRTENNEIGVFHIRNKYYAYSNYCPHQGGPVCEGVVMSKVEAKIAEDKTYQGMTFSENELHIVCPWHGYEYNIENGACIGDKRLKIKKYEVIEKGEDIYVNI